MASRQGVFALDVLRWRRVSSCPVRLGAGRQTWDRAEDTGTQVGVKEDTAQGEAGGRRRPLGGEAGQERDAWAGRGTSEDADGGSYQFHARACERLSERPFVMGTWSSVLPPPPASRRPRRRRHPRRTSPPRAVSSSPFRQVRPLPPPPPLSTQHRPSSHRVIETFH